MNIDKIANSLCLLVTAGIGFASALVSAVFLRILAAGNFPGAARCDVCSHLFLVSLVGGAMICIDAIVRKKSSVLLLFISLGCFFCIVISFAVA